ncbi:hypothetical protein [Streptomyces sp. NPDC085466]|uniref:hypothetical protein n=1 Tax=Streptomyces sp. NPDC085466 TaxID=3365725 RepID=UPI0037D239BA
MARSSTANSPNPLSSHRSSAAAGESPELARAHRLTYADLDSGHWPMTTRPRELAHVLAGIAAELATGDTTEIATEGRG